jgi:hypothetical protein
MKRVSKDLALFEITLRKYEKPRSVKERELVKKMCLSLGLLQPGDSRDVVVDVLYVLLKNKKRKREMNCAEIEKRVMQCRKLHKLPMIGIASSNIRRQLKRLRQLFLIEKVRNNYRTTEFANLLDVFEEKVERFLLQSALQRVKEYLKRVDEQFG